MRTGAWNGGRQATLAAAAGRMGRQDRRTVRAFLPLPSLVEGRFVFSPRSYKSRLEMFWLPFVLFCFCSGTASTLISHQWLLHAAELPVLGQKHVYKVEAGEGTVV